MNENPYQAPKEPSSGEEGAPEANPIWLYVLCVFVGIHIVLALGLIAIGVLVPMPEMVIGSVVSFVILIAIFVGLLKRQEWARIWLIWMTYVGILFMLPQISESAIVIIPAICLNVLTLILCHSPAVRRTTKTHSIAKSYTYRESSTDPESHAS